MIAIVAIVTKRADRRYPPFNGTSCTSICVLPTQNRKQVEFWKMTEEIDCSVVPLTDLDSLRIPTVCHDAFTHFAVPLVS
jgi:hypothetical protein